MIAEELFRIPSIRYALLALAALLVIIAAMTQMASVIIDEWSQRDIELRARLVFRSIRERVAVGLASKRESDLQPFFERLAEDERLLALAYCDNRGHLLYPTKELPSALRCPGPPIPKVDTFNVIREGGRSISVAEFPLSTTGNDGSLLVVHDLTYIARRAHEAEFYVALALVGVAGGLGLLATVIGLALLRGWTKSLRAAIANVNRGREASGPRHAELPIGRDIEAMLSELRLETGVRGRHPCRMVAENIAPAARRRTSGRRGDCRLEIAEPHIHNRVDGRVTVQTPASGLVTALEPVMRACGGVWVAHGSGDADRETVDATGHVRVPPGEDSYSLRRVWLTEAEEDGYYYGFSNEGLWPLCHVADARPSFRTSDFEHYRAVNQRFSDAVCEEVDTDDPIILVQDYHFALAPRMIRSRLPRATILTFWHIPWPSAERIGICPFRDELISGLLGSSILGFHTQGPLQ